MPQGQRHFLTLRDNYLTIGDVQVIRGTALTAYPQLVAELGADPAPLLRGAGINAGDVGNHDTFLPVVAVVRAIEDAAALTAPTDFGRQLARRQGIEILGPLGVAARTAATVADAFAVFGTFMAAYSPGLAVRVSPQANSGRSLFELRILAEGLPPHPHVTELSLGVSLRVLRFLLGADYSPLSVHLPHEPLAARKDYGQFFGCRTLFAEPISGFTIHTADLHRPLKQDALAHRAVVQYLNTLIVHDSTMSESVRAVVRQLLPTGAVSLEMIARQFQLHPKALQRRLSAEGTTFAALTDQVRRATAERYLRDTDITLQHLARELGYAEQSELSRSFRRWSGTAPTTYRKTLRAKKFGSTR